MLVRRSVLSRLDSFQSVIRKSGYRFSVEIMRNRVNKTDHNARGKSLHAEHVAAARKLWIEQDRPRG
jgi:hypothetical protein